MKPAFSTVACAEWTIAEVASRARAAGFDLVEFRTFDADSRSMACDPMLTDPAKVRRLLAAEGVEACSIATSASFDDRIKPPLIGEVFADKERGVRVTDRAVELAASIEAALVRVYPLRVPPRDTARATSRRIVDGLRRAVDRVDKSGVRLALENAGSFPRAGDVAELVEQVGSPLLGVCLNASNALAAGESHQDMTSVLRGKIYLARVHDRKADVPCPLGDGDLDPRSFIGALASVGYSGPVVYEWERLWTPGLSSAEHALPVASERLWRWIGETLETYGSVRSRAEQPVASLRT